MVSNLSFTSTRNRNSMKERAYIVFKNTQMSMQKHINGYGLLKARVHGENCDKKYQRLQMNYIDFKQPFS